MSAPARLRIGISGWRYAPWRGDFYPEGLRQKDELRFASRAVNSIEINGTFYALQTPERFRGWAEDTPEDFVFSVKAPRYITHVRRLREIDEPLANFFASGPLALRQRLGPFLWQFPPSMRFDRELFADFLARLPRDGAAAQKLARHSAARLYREGYLDGDPAQRLRHAVEIRHESFVDPTFIELLREYRVALVVADTAGKWPLLGDVCADFLYLRLHGDKELYRSGYSEAALGQWQARIHAWASGGQADDLRRASQDAPAKATARDLYCYFDNDVKVRAPYDARRLLQLLELDGSLRTVPGPLPDDLRESAA
ncbi:DUF72 domain-containing protein [Pseudomonas aeruginosa]|nr:DUF72 domain-containing protein [Pseudomonas aeruginosa]